MLLPNGHAARYDRVTDAIEVTYPLPIGPWGDYALGPDDNVYITPEAGRNEGRDNGLAYLVIAAGGKVLLTRGSDFDRLTVELPQKTLTAGKETVFTALSERSRDRLCSARAATARRQPRRVDGAGAGDAAAWRSAGAAGMDAVDVSKTWN